MSTYSTSHRVNDFDQLLNGRLGAAVAVLYPEYHGLPVVAQKIWEDTYPLPGMVPPLLAEGEGTPTKKDLNLGSICTSPFPYLDGNR
jgi:hypothetical protein